ncbi:MAG: DNA polymerase III subunit [Bdellovibrionales bacterium]
MRLSDHICGHGEIFEQWKNLQKRSALTGSFLFVGPPGVGKVKTAQALIQQILCESQKDLACGECGSCRRVASHQHESFLHVKPQNGIIKVEQAQEILRFCQLQSLSNKRFILIEEAELLGVATANSLLKTLEEPPAGTVFILTSPSASSLLPTIRSRAQVLHFKPVLFEEMQKSSKGPDWALRASLGRFDRLELLLSEDKKPLRELALKNLLQLTLNSDFLTDDSWKESLKNREEVRSELLIWLSYVRDALQLKLNRNENLLNPDFQQDLSRLLFLSEEKLHFLFGELLDLQKQLQFNKDAVLSLESLYIRLK